MDNDTAAVKLVGENIIGFIVEQHYGYARVRFTDEIGIEHLEYLNDEEYIPLEEWTRET